MNPIETGCRVRILSGCRALDVHRNETATVIATENMGSEYSHSVRVVLAFRTLTLVLWARHPNRLRDGECRLNNGNPYKAIRIQRV